MIYTIICPHGLGIWVKLWAWHILGCSATSEHSTACVNCSVSRGHHTDEKRMTDVKTFTHKVTWQVKTQIHTASQNRHCSSTTYEWGMRVMKASVWGYGAWSCISSEQQPGQLSWDLVEAGGVFVGWGWGQRIVTTSWGQSGETGTRTANQNITSAAPAHRQSHRAVKRRQCQSDSPQWQKGHFPPLQLYIFMLHIERTQTTTKTED